MSFRSTRLFFLTLICMLITLLSLAISSSAEFKEDVPGELYEFDKNSKYDFESSDDTVYFEKAGILTVSGDIDKDASVDNAEYVVKDGLLSFKYTPSGAYKNVGDDNWHFIDDGSKEVNDVILNDSIKMGAVIVQTSFNRNKWVTVSTETNVFADDLLSSPFYTTNDIQLINGCYYRVIVAYEITLTTDIKIPIIDVPVPFQDSYKKHAEVYEFYAVYSNTGDNNKNEGTYYLGKTESVAINDGFSNVIDMKKEDPHFGMDLGQFEIKGFTDYYSDNIFLKNVGDEILLQFKLNSDIDIDAIHDKKNLFINSVSDGFDRSLNVPSQNFGRGTFILRKTDYNGKIQEPIIYTNFLEALAYSGADTKIKLLEEGDYEVSLDYEIKNSDWLGTTYDYRIAFNFKIRNGDNAAYLKDSESGSELESNSSTPYGFTIDWARSRYLKTHITASYWEKDSDTSYRHNDIINEIAKESKIYDKKGVYIISTTNPTTDPNEKHPDVKRIYVGDDVVIKAAMRGEYASKSLDSAITEILKLQSDGYTIDESGILIPPKTSPPEELHHETQAVTLVTMPSSLTVDTEMAVEAMNTDVDISMSNDSNNIIPVFVGVAVILIIIGIIVIIIIKRRNGHNDK